MHPDPAIVDKREELAEARQCCGVARFDVFGSSACGADRDPLTGDADFLAEFRLGSGRAPLWRYFGFAGAFRRALGCPVGLIEADAIRSSCPRPAIVRSHELVYASRPLHPAGEHRPRGPGHRALR